MRATTLSGRLPSNSISRPDHRLTSATATEFGPPAERFVEAETKFCAGSETDAPTSKPKASARRERGKVAFKSGFTAAVQSISGDDYLNVQTISNFLG
jgi:hypothetical protein